MNAIINWVALNNTLLIRIGFSAVIILILVYAYRFFFVPEISVVKTEGEASSKSAGSGSGSVDLNIEELAELQSEVENLKHQLKQAMTERANAATASSSAGAGLDMVAEQNQDQEESKRATTELNEKVKTLEARLSEYEIIAEDIADIGKLRQENESLKAKLAEAAMSSITPKAAPAAQTAPEEEQEAEVFDTSNEVIFADDDAPVAATQEAAPVEAPVEEELNPELEALENYVATKATPKDEMTSQIVIKSDIEVTVEDKNNLNDFEKYLQMKKG